MKTILALIVLSLVSVNACAADAWSEADIARESAYLILHTIDYGQTSYISKHPNRFSEQNTILGRHPSQKMVDTYFLTTAILHVGAVHFMPKEWRPVFQSLWIGFEASAVTNNYRIGVKIDL